MDAKAGKIQSYNGGDVIFREGDEDKVLYKVLIGQVRICVNHGSENELTLSTLKTGDCFGEMSIIDQCPRSATAVAEIETTLIAYSQNDMSVFIVQNTGFVMDIMKNLSLRLRNSTNELERVYQMFLDASTKEETKLDSGIKEFMSRHTILDADGKPRFMIRV